MVRIFIVQNLKKRILVHATLNKYVYFISASYNSILQNNIKPARQLTICITSRPTRVLIKTFNPANSRAFNYARTINKSQGQTLTKVGIYLLQSVFLHGQLYIAMSRVKSYNGLQFTLVAASVNSMAMTSYTNNIVFKSALILQW